MTGGSEAALPKCRGRTDFLPEETERHRARERKQPVDEVEQPECRAAQGLRRRGHQVCPEEIADIGTWLNTIYR